MEEDRDEVREPLQEAEVSTSEDDASGVFSRSSRRCVRMQTVDEPIIRLYSRPVEPSGGGTMHVVEPSGGGTMHVVEPYVRSYARPLEPNGGVAMNVVAPTRGVNMRSEPMRFVGGRQNLPGNVSVMEAELREWAAAQNMTLVEGTPVFPQVMTRIVSDTVVPLIQPIHETLESINRRLISLTEAHQRNTRNLDENQNDEGGGFQNLINEGTHNENAIGQGELQIETRVPLDVPSRIVSEQQNQSRTESTLSQWADVNEGSDEETDFEMSEDEALRPTALEPTKRKNQDDSNLESKKSKK